MPIHMRMRKLRGPHMKKSMPFEPFRTHTQPVNIAALEERFDAGTEVTLELMKANGLGTRKDIPVKVLAKGEITKAADRPRPRLQRRRARAHRGGRRHLHCSSRARARPLRRGRRSRGARPSTRIGRSAGCGAGARCAADEPMLATILNAFQVADIRKKIAFTAGDAADLPARLARAGAGRQPDGGQQHPEAVRRLEHPRAAEPLLRRRPLADRDLRARHHALHHRLDHPAAAAGRGAVAGKALQGRRGRAGADHPVHALPHRRPRFRAVDRLRVPLPQRCRRKPANPSSRSSTRRTSS